jgi:hypothetical protein
MATYVETWKGIGLALGRSERWCRYMAQREQDPLPVVKVGGIVRLYLVERDIWVSRQQGHPDIRERRIQVPHLKLMA